MKKSTVKKMKAGDVFQDRQGNRWTVMKVECFFDTGRTDIYADENVGVLATNGEMNRSFNANEMEEVK